MKTTAPLLMLAMFAFGCGPADEDGDGFPSSTDCDDSNPTVFPSAVELCDGVDNDCDNLIDEQAIDARLFFLDEDGDLHGTTKESLTACEAPAGFVADASDCDDADPEANPSAPELCNLKDDNCNGIVDDNPEDAPLWYADADKDGWGSNSLIEKACEGPDGYITVAGDCNDFDFYINPVALEYCDMVDNDCDGVVDEPDAEDHSVFYRDADGDGFGDSDVQNSAIDACFLPDGYSENAEDCNDDPAGEPLGHLQNPGLEELCRDGIDNNCDGDGNQCWYQSWETSAAATRTVSGLSGSSFGYDTVPAGDVDGDGIEDFLFGAYYADVGSGRTGAAHLFYGRVDGDFTPDDVKLKAKDMPTFHSMSAYDYTARTVAAGEFNADKYGDLAVGTPSFDKADSYSSEGQVALVYGSSKRFSGLYDLEDGTFATFYGENRSDGFGYGLTVGMSVGTDSVQDMMVGAPYFKVDGNYGAGAVYIIPGVRGSDYSGASGVADFARITAVDRYSYLGFGGDTIAMGDFNGDGRGDMVVGGYGVDSYLGGVFLWWGTGVDPKGDISIDTADVSISGTRQLGRSIAHIPDLNDDGYDELVLGEGYANSYSGACYVFLGSSKGLGSKLTGADITITGPGSGYLCYNKADSGDINGDGTPELVMGAYRMRDKQNAYVGAMYILEGGADIALGELDAADDMDGTVEGDLGSYSYFGYKTEILDYNNDGYDDIFVSAYGPSKVVIFDGTDW